MVSQLPNGDSSVNNGGRQAAWKRFYIYVTIAIGLAFLNLYLWGVMTEWRHLPFTAELEAPEAKSFDGRSQGLSESVFVATPKRPIPDGKSAIWCCTMPMAWKELEGALKGSIEVAGVDDICRELRSTPQAELDPAHYFAAGGSIEDGIHERIQKGMAQRFPKARMMDRIDSLPPHRAVGYAYLEVALLYDYLFKHEERPLTFREPGGRAKQVHAFGLRERDKGEGGPTREQVLVLFRDKDEFAVDLSHNTKPYQIILARINRKATLDETLAYLGQRMTNVEPKHLSHQSVLLVPTMNWRIDHDYQDLLGPITNMPTWAVVVAHQSIQFKMDRKGAYVLSEAVMGTDNGHPIDMNPDYFLFDRPFLIVLKKRGTQQPFFMMWVENAELMQPSAS